MPLTRCPTLHPLLKVIMWQMNAHQVIFMESALYNVVQKQSRCGFRPRFLLVLGGLMGTLNLLWTSIYPLSVTTSSLLWGCGVFCWQGTPWTSHQLIAGLLWTYVQKRPSELKNKRRLHMLCFDNATKQLWKVEASLSELKKNNNLKT